MTSDFSQLEVRIRAARAELGATIEQAWQDLARFKRENQPTEEERQALQEAALRGDLGDDMRELATRIDRDEDSWDAVFTGESPNLELLRGHLERMIDENRQAILDAFEEEEEFDLDALRRDAER